MAAEIFSSAIMSELLFGNWEKRPQNQITGKLYPFHKLYRLAKFGRGTTQNSPISWSWGPEIVKV